MKKLFLLMLVAFFTGSLSLAQESPVKFGEIDRKNLEMSVYPKDSSAGAVVLMNWGYVNFDHNFEVQFEHHIRIKIFNSTEFDLADVEIPYFRKDRVERLKAATYNLEGGEIVTYEVEKGDMFDETATDYVKKLKFSLSNVREGSIIEYTYRVNYGSYNRILPWYFQKEIPVMHSEYYVELPEIFEYKRIMRGYLPLKEAEISKKNINYQGTPLTLTTQHYVAKDIPAFVEEPFLTTKEDFISKISFELYAVSIPGSTYDRRMPNSYEELAYNLALSTEFGKRVEKTRFLRDEVERVTAGISGEEEKARAIYKFIQDEFKVDYDFEEDNYKKIYDERRGFAREINFILIMMLKEAGIETEPVVLSTREHGLVHPAYPSFRNFDYVLAQATIGENTYLLDASDKFLPFNAIAEKCLNGRGLVVSETNPRWINLEPSFSNMRVISAQCKISPEGTVQAEMKIDRRGYLAMDFRKNREEEDDDYLKDFQDNHAAWTIEGHKIEGLDSQEEDLVEYISLEAPDAAEMLGNTLHINPLLIGAHETNPFKSTERIYPVNYGAPIRHVMSYSFEIPEGYEIDELPEPMAVGLPDNAGKFLYSVSNVGRMIMVNAQFNITRVEFSSEEYPYLRAFYGQVVAKEAERIVLKKKT